MTTVTIAVPGVRRNLRLRVAGVLGAVLALHVLGWTLFLLESRTYAGAGAFAGAGTLAYALGVRHAFDADHIAAIDDATRLMVAQGRRPVGVGFFFALGHSSVVVVLALVAAFAAGWVSVGDLGPVEEVGGLVAAAVAVLFLLAVAGINAVVLRGLVLARRRYRAGEADEEQIELLLLNRGLLNRVLGGRARALVRSSWHMYPLGILFGLGLETASEVALLALSATTVSDGGLSFLAVLSLPLLFAAGMSAFDTCDGLLMTRAYAWSQQKPARRLSYNILTTALTVAIGAFVSSVYLAGLLADEAGWTWLTPYGALAGHFEYIGYAVAALFLAVWATAAVRRRAVPDGPGGVPERSAVRPSVHV
ncbi:HoxN/HupN/NixA family nickel/cobalt transporter [Geodermatophilus ruber]|uniref:Nickel/cobalt efflux system n=1 Tax=Geodermatophilus ruber TaxID=504800 RepID=A0A1I4BNE9_9ACTN|nr:HoxN/HupN/NixA family nickel/cobalt transporter [Geodermatophilus ruber]SFK69717.1 high-affinity nickel-transport protein [Geodermatophilus ruber]